MRLAKQNDHHDAATGRFTHGPGGSAAFGSKSVTALPPEHDDDIFKNPTLQGKQNQTPFAPLTGDKATNHRQGVYIDTDYLMHLGSGNPDITIPHFNAALARLVRSPADHPPVNVDVKTLRSGQQHVLTSAVQSYLNQASRVSSASGSTTRSVPLYPVVARVNGENWIVDGNHRMTADYLLGKKFAKAHVIDMTGVG